MKLNDVKGYKNYLRKSKETLLGILGITAPVITRQTINILDPIPTDLKLAVTICNFFTGVTFTDLQCIFRVISLIHNLCNKNGIKSIVKRHFLQIYNK